jgi:hypothetical protein
VRTRQPRQGHLIDDAEYPLHLHPAAGRPGKGEVSPDLQVGQELRAVGQTVASADTPGHTPGTLVPVSAEWTRFHNDQYHLVIRFLMRSAVRQPAKARSSDSMTSDRVDLVALLHPATTLVNIVILPVPAFPAAGSYSGSRNLGGGIRRSCLGADGDDCGPQRSADYLVVEGAPRSACPRQCRYQAGGIEPVHYRPDEAVSERGVRRDHARGHERIASGREPIHR